MNDVYANEAQAEEALYEATKETRCPYCGDMENISIEYFTNKKSLKCETITWTCDLCLRHFKTYLDLDDDYAPKPQPQIIRPVPIKKPVML